MKRALTCIAVGLLLSLLAVSSAAAGPRPGNGPWVACPDSDEYCASQVGPDVVPGDDDFDCLTRSGQPGYALWSVNNARVGCWRS